MCASFRRTARALTQLYEDELRPLGLRATQFTVLQALALAGEVTQGELGQVLAMDSTTLTRTLAIMARRGWVTKRYGNDKRERHLRLTRAGQDQLSRATSEWEKLQARLRRHLGNDRWQELLNLTNQVTTLVMKGDVS
jgi:DNA-binding MarR family transcriptional regulator